MPRPRVTCWSTVVRFPRQRNVKPSRSHFWYWPMASKAPRLHSIVEWIESGGHCDHYCGIAGCAQSVNNGWSLSEVLKNSLRNNNLPILGAERIIMP